MIEPINKIEPLREDLRKLVPDDYLTTTSFKRWVVANNLQDVWNECLQYVKSKQTMIVVGYMREIESGDALTLLLNHLYQTDVSNFGKFIVKLLTYYCQTEGKKLDVTDLRMDMLVVGIHENEIAGLDKLTENGSSEDVSDMTDEQKVRKLEKEYVAEMEIEPNSHSAINAYLKWHTEAVLYLGDFYSIDNLDFERFKSMDNSSNGYGLRTNYQSSLATYNLLMKNTSKQQTKESTNAVKTPMLFISHSSKDKPFVEALVDMLESLGFTPKNLFCSSVNGYGIPLSGDVFETLRTLFSEHDLYVIFVHSPRYYNSIVSLNEMGAAWVLKKNFCSLLTNDMQFDGMKGVVNDYSISIKVNSNESAARLTELKDQLTKKFSLPSMDQIKWERKRTRFLDIVNSIKNG